MTSSHRHGTTGKLATAGNVDARLDALEAAVAKLTAYPITPAIPASGTVWTAPSTVTTDQLGMAMLDGRLDIIEMPPLVQLAKGVTGDAPPVHGGIDRSTRPLTIRPAGGAPTFRMIGTPGLVYYDGQFSWIGAKSITVLGLEADGYTLNQTGFHNIQGTTDLYLRTKLSGVTLGPTTDPWKTYAAYIANARNDRLTLDLECIGAGNLWSGAQIDSESMTNPPTQGAITVRLTGSDLAFAFYENVPTDALTLTASLTRCREVVQGSAAGRTPTGASVVFHKAKGTYRVTKDLASGPIVLNGALMAAA